jgi:pimeloyl-ACP methyl ester carboxylesterase
VRCVNKANYDKFSSQFDRIVAIDWLGMGGSSRCRTLPQAPLLWGSFQQSQAVDYFIDSLEVCVFSTLLCVLLSLKAKLYVNVGSSAGTWD